MLRLQCAEILHTLRHKPILVSLPPDGEPIPITTKDKRFGPMLAPLLARIHQSQKFIFDSGSDQDERTTTAVRQTALAMMEANLFHQPHPVMWIEDPYEEDPENYRNFYLAIETADRIEIRFLSKLPAMGLTLHGKAVPRLSVHPLRLVIDLANPTDQFRIEGATELSALYAKILSEAVYAYKKLIVALNTENLLIEKITSAKKGWEGDSLHGRPYDHTVVRIPLDDPQPQSSGQGHRLGVQVTKRKHLVRGYVYGKHTRPVEEQRWIRPYWRGEGETKRIVERHYVVG